jgi:hypothetical protein
MTLLATEIHNHTDPDRAAVVFAADRKITNTRTGAHMGTHRKIFELEWMNAAIGYFGLAELPGPRGNRPMQIWLEAFIRKNSDARTLGEFSKRLTSDLNHLVPKHWHRTACSGFHIAGFNEAGKPEFWFVRNIDDAFEPTLGMYEAREDFQRRDAPRLLSNETMIYRNGDIRAHVAAWKQIDESFGALLNVPGFRRLKNSEDYAEWVRFKMEIIAYFYKKFSPHPIIARPIDVILIKSRL